MNFRPSDPSAAPEVRLPASAGTLAGPKVHLAPVLLDMFAADTVAMLVGSARKRTAAVKRKQAVVQLAQAALTRFNAQRTAERVTKRQAATQVDAAVEAATPKASARKKAPEKNAGVPS